MTIRGSGCITRGCRPRAGWAGAFSPSRPGSSASRWCRRRSMRRATACGRSGPLPTFRRRWGAPVCGAGGPGGRVESTFEVYGFAMLDMGHDFKQIDPNWFDTMRVTKLPSVADEFGRDDNTFAGVRQSRLGVRSSTPTAVGDLKTTFEFELFGTGVDEGQTTFRLRHAYGELGQFGAGQTWSPFMDPDVFPNSLEYWGPTGMVFFRNVQVRWMPVQGEHALVRSSGRARAATRGSSPIGSSWTAFGGASRCRTCRAPTSGRRGGVTSGRPAWCARSSGTTRSPTRSSSRATRRGGGLPEVRT